MLHIAARHPSPGNALLERYSDYAACRAAVPMSQRFRDRPSNYGRRSPRAGNGFEPYTVAVNVTACPEKHGQVIGADSGPSISPQPRWSASAKRHSLFPVLHPKEIMLAVR